MSFISYWLWECEKTVIEYIEEGRQYLDVAVSVLFDFMMKVQELKE